MATDWGVAKTLSWNEGRSDRGRVGGEEGAVFLPGSGNFPGAFKVMRPWLSQGKSTLGGRVGGTEVCG